MNSLLELTTLTKGIEYLLVLAFLFAYIAFWQWQRHRGTGLAAKTIPMLVLALGFAGLASTCIGARATATPQPETWFSVDDAHYLANIYGPAKFAAHEMGPGIVSCQTCHHNSPEGKPLPCKDCHSAPVGGTEDGRPGLKAAYHQKCQDCHKEALSGPMTCTRCHTEKPGAEELKKKSPSPATPPAVQHSLLAGYSNCFTCHRPEGPLPLPGNHVNYRANVTCLGCHKPAMDQKALSMMPVVEIKVEAPPAAPAPASPAAPAAAAPQSSSTGKISHDLAGKENCLMCHPVGGGVKPSPADHAGRGNESCQLCHKP